MNIAIFEHHLTMSSKDIAELVELRHDNVKRTMDTLLERGLITFTQIEEKSTGGRPAEIYMVGKRDSYVVVAQLSPEFTARLVDRWQELETQHKSLVPDFSNPAEAARAWADQYEARLRAEHTKAEIGSRREATAMNTASQAVKKVNRLQIELDRSKDYATMKRMEMLYPGFRFDWRLLKTTWVEMGVPPIDVFDQNYGTVKAYHRSVWWEAYALDF